MQRTFTPIQTLLKQMQQAKEKIQNSDAYNHLTQACHYAHEKLASTKAYKACGTVLKYTKKGAQYGAYTGAISEPMIGLVGNLGIGLITSVCFHAPLGKMLSYEAGEGLQAVPVRVVQGSIGGAMVGAAAGAVYGTYQVLFGVEKPKESYSPLHSQFKPAKQSPYPSYEELRELKGLRT